MEKFKIGDKVFASDWCYGTIVDVDSAQNQVMVEFETSGGGGTASFDIKDVRLEKQETYEINMLEKIAGVISDVTEDMDANAPCSCKKPMSSAYCKTCKFNEARMQNRGRSCEAYNKAKALIDAGMCIKADLIDQIFNDIDVALALSLIPAHVRGVEDVPDYYEGDLTNAINSIKEKYGYFKN